MSEKLLCYFAVALAEEGLAPQSIKTYLAAARSMHISLGFPDPRVNSSLPILRRIQAGIQRVQATKGTPSSRVRLPITPPILDRLREHWQTTEHPNKLCLWAVATLCFAGFFRLGELLPSSIQQAGTGAGLQWGDVTVDDAQTPSMVRTHLRRSKCDQFGKGVNVYVGKVDGPRYPVVAVVAYMTSRGTNQAPNETNAVVNEPCVKRSFNKRCSKRSFNKRYTVLQYSVLQYSVLQYSVLQRSRLRSAS